MSFNFVGQFKALIFLSKHHRQMCLVHEIDQRIICKKSYGQSVAMISLHDIPIHLFRIQRKRLMMNCSITTINQAHKHSLKGFFNDIRSVTRVILFIHTNFGSIQIGGHGTAKILPVLLPIGVRKTTYLKLVTPVEQSNWRSRMGYVSANLQKSGSDVLAWSAIRMPQSEGKLCTSMPMKLKVYIHATQTDAMVCLISIVLFLKDPLSVAGRDDV